MCEGHGHAGVSVCFSDIFLLMLHPHASTPSTPHRQLSLAMQMLQVLSRLSEELQRFAQRHILDKQQALDQVQSVCVRVCMYKKCVLVRG